MALTTAAGFVTPVRFSLSLQQLPALPRLMCQRQNGAAGQAGIALIYICQTAVVGAVLKPTGMEARRCRHFIAGGDLRFRCIYYQLVDQHKTDAVHCGLSDLTPPRCGSPIFTTQAAIYARFQNPASTSSKRAIHMGHCLFNLLQPILCVVMGFQKRCVFTCRARCYISADFCGKGL